ncbi:unnamed protein product [Lampetra fluviatilis]
MEGFGDPCVLHKVLSVLHENTGEHEMQELLEHLNAELKENAHMIERGLEEMGAELSAVFPGDEPPARAAEQLAWLARKDMGSLWPSQTPQPKVARFLSEILRMLRSEQGLDDEVLQLLLEISSRSGVLFPSHPSGTAFQFSSLASLNAAEDTSALDVQSLWESTRLHLRTHLLRRLAAISAATGTARAQHLTRLRCLQSLAFLYPPDEFLPKYKTMRAKQLQDLLRRCGMNPAKEFESGSAVNLGSFALSLAEAVPQICMLMVEDHAAVGGVAGCEVASRFLQEVFLEEIEEELVGALGQPLLLLLPDGPACKDGRRPTGKRNTVDESAMLAQDTLSQLTRVMSSLLKMDKRLRELAWSALASSAGVNEGPLKKGSPGLVSPEPHSKKKPGTSQALEWEWKTLFQDLSGPMARSLLQTGAEITGRWSQKSPAGGPSLLVSASVMEGGGSHRCTVFEASAFCAGVADELEFFFPLAVAGREGPLREVGTAFVSVCCDVTACVLRRLREYGRGGADDGPVNTLYTALSSAAFMHGRLRSFCDALADRSFTLPLSATLKQWQEFMSGICDSITDYHVGVLTTSILHDSESHHWADPRPFYEGERCSFSLQMWHCHLGALWSDLRRSLTPALARSLLASVLGRSLAPLAARYARARPSERRTPQVRADITAALAYSAWHLLGVCRGWRELLEPEGSGGDEHAELLSPIHAHCGSLLATLAVGTAPLDQLHLAFKDGFPAVERAPRLRKDGPRPGLAPLWLQWMRPGLFGKGPERVYEHVRLLLAQPRLDRDLLVQTLAFENGLLSKALLVNTGVEQWRPQQRANAGPEGGGRSLAQAVLLTLGSCEGSPCVLRDVMREYLDRHALWDHVVISPEGDGSQESAVSESLRLLLSPARDVLLLPVLELLEASRAAGSDAAKELPPSLVGKIPPEWGFSASQKQGFPGTVDFVERALEATVQTLPLAAASISTPIKVFFSSVAPEDGGGAAGGLSKLRPPHGSLLLYALCALLCRTLKDGNAVEEATGVTLDRAAAEALALVADCVRAVAMEGRDDSGDGGGGDGCSPSVRRTVQALRKRRPGWVEATLARAARIVGAQRCDAESGTRGAARPLVLPPAAPPSRRRPGGPLYLRRIHHAVSTNEMWLAQQLGGDRRVQVEQTPAEFVLSDSEPPSDFNPVSSLCHIGTEPLQQAQLFSWPWDWSALLQAHLGLTKPSFACLLANRWEMQEDATLDEEERVMVEHLRNVYLDTAETRGFHA